MFSCMDDKAKVPIGEPGEPSSTNVRNRPTLAVKGNCSDFLIFCFVHILSALVLLVKVAKYYCLRSSILGGIGS